MEYGIGLRFYRSGRYSAYPKYTPEPLWAKRQRLLGITKSGQYSVRSGYRIAEEMTAAQEDTFYSESSTTSLKAQIWKLKTTRKIKHFLWQALSGCIATTSRLTYRHCGNDRVCPRCGAENETINHMLFECPPAKQCWALSSIPTPPGLFPCSSLFTNFDFLLGKAREGGVQQDTLLTFPWLLWYIWKARNEKTFNGKEISPLDTLQMATQETESWRLAQIMEESAEEMEDMPEPTSLNHPRTPAPTNPEAILCRIDASWVHDAKLVGFGFVATKGSERWMVGLGAELNNRSPLHAEMEALMWSMQHMIRLGRLDVHFESDCALMIKIIHEEEEWPSLEMELEEFLMLRQQFENFTISYIPRSENTRADFLAKSSRSRDSPFSYVGQLVPQWLGHHPNLFAPV